VSFSAIHSAARGAPLGAVIVAPPAALGGRSRIATLTV
jgi:hypothetical protein